MAPGRDPCPACGACPLSAFTCRPRCGACCSALSISTSFPGMPGGKPAGVPCPHLDDAYRCRIYHDPARPKCCAGLRATAEMCGAGREEALAYLEALERLTRP